MALQLLNSEFPDRPLCVRQLGIGVSDLQKQQSVQQSLSAEEQDERDARLDEVADQILSWFLNNLTARRQKCEVQS